MILFFFSCDTKRKNIQLVSPSNDIKITVENDNNITYSVYFKNEPVISRSLLGISFKDGSRIFEKPFITNVEEELIDDTWELPWGEVNKIRNNYREKKISIRDDENSMLVDLIFRAYDDGIAFRYFVNDRESEGLEKTIINELSEFNLVEDATAWWIPAYGENRYEELYRKSNITNLDTVHTPLTIRYSNGTHISIHESELVDYSSMQVFRLEENKLQCDLAPWKNGDKVRTRFPFRTPWRTIKITDSAGELITSYLTLNCNKPNEIKDISWIKPSKYIGIWWGMIIGKWTWGEGPRHGATNERGYKYIDFASKHGFDEVLIEGWQSGFKGLFPDDSVTVSFTEWTDDFDLEKIQKYALSKGVSLQAYHETSANTVNYLAQIDSAFSLLNRLGIKNAKIGQVGNLLDRSEYHYGQYGIDYYRKVLLKALDYKIGVNFHEPIKDTGERRTFPNMLTREGARGMEYNAWSGGNPPHHTTILPFTRLLNAPMDFTPGIFDLRFENLDSDVKLEFPVTFTVVDSGNGYNQLAFISEESVWKRKSMICDTISSNGRSIYKWTITQDCQAGKWEWGVVADHADLGRYNIWLPQLVGDGTNREFKVSKDGHVTGQTLIIIPSNNQDLSGVYSSDVKEEFDNQRVSTTLAKQLALYVVIHSPLQMAADFIENYDGIEAFEFIKDVPIDWDTTVVVNGEIGEYLTIARRGKGKKDWYIGSITNEQSRSFDIDLSFLGKGRYKATIYADRDDADWDKNPNVYEINNKYFTSTDVHSITLANGGGQAIKLKYVPN